MKKTITIAVIVLVCLGLAVFLFKISPQQAPSTGSYSNFDQSASQHIDQPGPVTDEDHVEGSADAKNTFIVYEDFQCPACGYAYSSVLSKVLDVFPNTKLVFRHFPLVTLHPNAAEAAYASEAAAAQGKFWEMYNQLYTYQNDWANLQDPLPKFAEYAQAAGVADISQFRADITGMKQKDRIQRDITEANELGVTGTPTYYFNGHLLQNGDINQLQQQAAPYIIQ